MPVFQSNTIATYLWDRTLGGIFDTLGGNHGQNFTYLPIVYQDDVQVHLGEHRFHQSAKTYYVVKIQFLGERSSFLK
jgi:hypothetical protein